MLFRSTGTTVLTAADTYGGGTTISAGTLQLGNGGSAGSVTGNVTDNAALAIDRSDTFTFGTVISGSGAFNQLGTGTTMLTAADTYGGGTTISAGTLQLGDGTNDGSITGNVTDNAAFADDDSGSNTLSGVISGGGAFKQLGTGTTILTAADTYGGGTTISAGTLQLGNGTSDGSVTGNVLDNATLADDDSGSNTLSGVISGSGAFKQLGTGTTVLTAAETYGGGTTISAGTLQLGNGTNDGSITGNVLDNTTLADDDSGSNTLSGVISGSGAFKQLGTGTTMLTAAESYTGGTTVDAGTLQLGAGGSLANGSNLTINGGTFDLNGHNQTIGDLSGTGGAVTLDSGILEFGTADSTIYSGTISGAGGLTKSGSGTTTLLGNDSAPGTFIVAGTLQLGNGGTSGSLSGDVLDDATFAVDRSNIATLAGTISGSGAFQQIGSGTTILTAADTYRGGTTISAGTLQLGNGGTSGSITGSVTDDATFTIDRSDAFTFGGSISGSGALQQIGTGTTILTAADSVSGATTIGAGTLELGSGGSITGNATFADAGNAETLRLDTGSNQLGGSIGGFALNDSIDLGFLGFSSSIFAEWQENGGNTGGTLSLQEENGPTLATLNLTGQYGPANFSLTSDGNGGTAIGFRNVPSWFTVDPGPSPGGDRPQFMTSDPGPSSGGDGSQFMTSDPGPSSGSDGSQFMVSDPGPSLFMTSDPGPSSGGNGSQFMVSSDPGPSSFMTSDPGPSSGGGGSQFMVSDPGPSSFMVSDRFGASGWLPQAMQQAPVETAGWLTEAMQTSGAASQPSPAGTGFGSNAGPIAGTLAASGPGFDAGSDPIAGTMSLTSLAMANTIQTHTA